MEADLGTTQQQHCAIIHCREIPMKLFDLNCKVVLITGASGGIGQAVAQRFYERGANLVLTDIAQDDLNRTFASMNSDRVLLVPLDVTDMLATKAVVQQAIKRFGRLDMVMAAMFGVFFTALRYLVVSCVDLTCCNIMVSEKLCLA